jgi:tetratricopeptide (TPR) repeat protein
MQTATYVSATQGPGAPEARICYERAESLCQSLGRTPLLYALIGQWRYIMMYDLAAAMEFAERIYSLAEEPHDPMLICWTCNALAATHLFRGDFESAGEYAMRGVQIWRSGVGQSSPEDVDTPVVGCLCYKAFSEWHLGETASCTARQDEAISLAKELNDMHALAEALGWAGGLAIIERNHAEVDRLSSELIELSLRYGFLRWQAIGTVFRGWVRCASGNTAEGLPCIQQGIRELAATGAVLPNQLRLKAEALYLADRTSEALEAINEAEKVVERSGERMLCAELQRLRGVFLIAMGADEAQIDASFCEAISTARKQKSVSLEKRAEATYAEYRRQASASGGRGFRLPLC